MHTIAAVLLAALLIGTGLTHWVYPAYYRSMVPSWIGWARPIAVWSGVADVLAGAAVLIPATRTWGAVAAAALVTVYLVSHVDALVHADPAKPRFFDRRPGAVLRIAVNLGYITWAILLAVPGAGSA